MFVSQIGESYEDTSGLEEGDGGEAEAELLELAMGVAPSGAIEKQKPIPPRKPVPVQRMPYAQLDNNAIKQAYLTSVHANNLVRARTVHCCRTIARLSDHVCSHGHLLAAFVCRFITVTVCWVW